MVRASSRRPARPERAASRMIGDLARAFGALGDRRARGVVWLGVGLSLLTLALLDAGRRRASGTELAATSYRLAQSDHRGSGHRSAP